MTKQKKTKEKESLYKEVKSKSLFNRSEVIVLTIITCVIGIILGVLFGYNLKKGTYKKYSPDLEEFIKNYNYIVDNNVAEVSNTELIKGAIEGMLSKFEDNYSYVFDEDDQEFFNIKLKGEYEGIGVQLATTTDNRVFVYTVFSDSPADKVGMKPGDQIIKIDDLTIGEGSTDISSYIKEHPDKKYEIVLLRDDVERVVEVERNLVTINSVYSEMKEVDGKKIGYIYMNIFASATTKQFKAKLEQLEKDGMEGLIIDVRYNNGGHLTTATEIISLFLDSSNIIYQTDKNGKIEKFYSSGNETKKYPIVILQNRSSASASEMLASSLKEQYGAIIVGENSYGKGTVQELITLSDGTEYKFTTKKWLTPKGNWINDKGVDVDYNVVLDEEYFNNPIDENDAQLMKAFEILKETK